MKAIWKQRLALYLAILLVLPTVMMALPMNTVEAQAAGWVSIYANYGGYREFQIEAGQKVEIGDYVSVYTSSASGCASIFSGVKYKSSKPKVASVSKKGILTTKNPGETTLTFTYKGKKCTMNVTVVKAGSFSSNAKVKKMQQEAAKLSKLVPSKLTKDNCLKAIQQYQTCKKLFTKNSKLVSLSGIKAKGTDYSAPDKLLIPEAGALMKAEALFSNYYAKNNPLSTTSAKALKPVSVTASAAKNSITVELNKAPTTEQMIAFACYQAVYTNTKVKSLNSVQALVYGWNAEETTFMTYTFTVKKGSATMTGSAKPKLASGGAYKLGGSLDWGRNMQFVAQ